MIIFDFEGYKTTDMIKQGRWQRLIQEEISKLDNKANTSDKEYPKDQKL